VKSKDWIQLVQDRDQWQALFNAVVNTRVSYKAGNFLTNWETQILKKESTPWS